MSEIIHSSLNSNPESGNSLTKLELKSAKDSLLSALQKDHNPYPDHLGYTAVWDKYAHDKHEQGFFKSLIMKDKKIYIAGKEISLISNTVNIPTLISPKYNIRQDNTSQYMTGREAMYECAERGYSLLPYDKQVIENFLAVFPGDALKDKIKSLVSLLDINTGWLFLEYENGRERLIGKKNNIGQVLLSEFDPNNSGCYSIWRSDDDAKLIWDAQDIKRQIIAYKKHV